MYAREETIALGNKGFGFHQKPFPQDLHSKAILENLPLGYKNASDEVHHIFGVQDHLRMLIQDLDEEECEQMLRYLNQNGVRFANDPVNLVSLEKKPHQQVHRTQQDRGIDTAGRKDNLNVIGNVAGLPFKERMRAAQVYCEFIYPQIVSDLHAQGIMVPTQEENIKRFKQEQAEEALLERMDHAHELKEQLRGTLETKPAINNKSGKELRGQKRSEFYANDLIDIVRNDRQVGELGTDRARSTAKDRSRQYINRKSARRNPMPAYWPSTEGIDVF